MGNKILHIAPFNTAGVPITFVKAERNLGYESRLVTLGIGRQDREEDIALNLRFLDSPFTRFAKQIFTPESRRKIGNRAKIPKTIPIKWYPSGLGEKTLIKLREKLWEKKIDQFFRSIDIDHFDIIQLDGGLGFFRDGRVVQRLKSRKKKIICCYTGSDLRTRGVIPQIDELSDLNVTVEFDHLQYHPHIYHVPFPFNFTEFPYSPKSYENLNKFIKIGHAPTNRLAKGSDQIIKIIQSLAIQFPIQLDLIENMSYEMALKRKYECDLFVDQIGDLGYGMNGVESLAMGIPTLTSLAPGFETIYPDHPFIVVDAKNFKSKLEHLLNNSQFIAEIGKRSIEWVKKHHDATEVVKRIHALLNGAEATK